MCPLSDCRKLSDCRTVGAVGAVVAVVAVVAVGPTVSYRYLAASYEHDRRTELVGTNGAATCDLSSLCSSWAFLRSSARGAISRPMFRARATAARSLGANSEARSLLRDTLHSALTRLDTILSRQGSAARRAPAVRCARDGEATITACMTVRCSEQLNAPHSDGHSLIPAPGVGTGELTGVYWCVVSGEMVTL